MDLLTCEGGLSNSPSQQVQHVSLLCSIIYSRVRKGLKAHVLATNISISHKDISMSEPNLGLDPIREQCQLLKRILYV